VISECQHVATLGAGGFGRVTLVKYRGGSYALKQMAKGHIVDNKLVAHVHREKKVRFVTVQKRKTCIHACSQSAMCALHCAA
jgi:serine/threonine protein kinase